MPTLFWKVALKHWRGIGNSKVALCCSLTGSSKSFELFVLIWLEQRLHTNLNVYYINVLTSDFFMRSEMTLLPYAMKDEDNPFWYFTIETITLFPHIHSLGYVGFFSLINFLILFYDLPQWGEIFAIRNLEQFLGARQLCNHLTFCTNPPRLWCAIIQTF